MAVVRFYLLLVLIPLSTFSQAQMDLKRGLLACYAFSGNTNDGSGNNFHGTLYGATLTSDRYGNPDKAYLFDGVDDYIQLPAHPFSPSNYTYSVWIRTVNFPNEHMGGVISIGNAEGSDHGVEVWHTKNYIDPSALGLAFKSILSATSTFHATLPLSSPSQWHHIVTSRTDTHVKIYIDGIMVGNTTINVDGSRSPVFYEHPLIALIGMRSSFNFPFPGIIDDVALYSRDLSAEEVWKLYSEGLPCSVLPMPNMADVTQCGEGPVTLMASGGTQYKWYNSEIGGQLLFEGNPFTIFAAQTNSYYVSNLTEAGESKRRKVTITINPQPELTCHFPSTVYTDDAEIYRVEPNSGSPPFNYTFTFGDGSEFNTSNNEYEHIYTEEGSYIVNVTTTDLMGCVASCSAPIKIDKEVFFIPNIITPNHDQHNEVFTLYNKTASAFQTYSGKKTFEMHIYNRWGGEVFKSNNALTGWQAHNVAAGVYYFEITVGWRKFKGTVVVLK